MLEILRSPAYFFDLKSHRILSVNRQFEQMMGYTRDQLLAMTLEQLRAPEDLPKLERALAKAPAEGVVEWRYIQQSGRPVYVLISYRNNQLLDMDGISHKVRLVVVSRFATEPIRPVPALSRANAPAF